MRVIFSGIIVILIGVFILFWIATTWEFFDGSGGASGRSFIRYQRACPSAAANEQASEAYRNLDQDAFDDTGCVSIRPEMNYRIVECDAEIEQHNLDKFGYAVPKVTDLPELMCTIAISQNNETPQYLFIYLPDVILLDPK